MKFEIASQSFLNCSFLWTLSFLIRDFDGDLGERGCLCETVSRKLERNARTDINATGSLRARTD